MSKWETVSFSAIADFKNGLNFTSGETGYELKMLGVGDFQNRNTLSQVGDLSAIHTEKEVNSSYYLQDGDLVFVRSNGNKALVGRCMLIQKPAENISFSGFTIRARLKSKGVRPEFINLLMQGGILKKALKRDGRGTNISNLNQGMLSKLDISMPNIEEQSIILDFFGSWDRVIGKTKALITAKELQFDRLVRELIGKPASNWHSSSLKNIAHVKKGQQLNRDTFDKSGEYPVWNGGVQPSGYTDKYNALANTITISEGGNSCGFVNFSNEKFWLGGHCYALEKIVSDIYPEFLFFFLKSQQRCIMRLRTGSALPNIQRKDIEKLEVKYPGFQEQQRIAKILNTAKKEINLLNALAERYCTQKRGLMQKLLSGEWNMKNKEAVQ